MVALVENELENRSHHLGRDSLLLGALHVDDMMLDAVSRDKVHVLNVSLVPLDQSTAADVRPESPTQKGGDAAALAITRTLWSSSSGP